MEGMLFEGLTGEKLRKALLVVVVLLGVFLVVQAIAGIQGLRYIGAGLTATNTINVSGHGEVFAKPDIATFTFSVSSVKATVSAAQDDATQKVNAAVAYLKGAGIEEKDIKTTDYSVNPQYEYQAQVCTNGYCPPGRQTLKGYEVRQTTAVKVHNTAKAGDLLVGVGSKGATEVSGLSFTFDDPTGVQQQARDKAIAEAKLKAEVLAKSLGVTLVRVVSFNENGNAPSPMYYSKAGGMATADSAPAAPEISVGQNKTTSDVSITYEIR